MTAIHILLHAGNVTTSVVNNVTSINVTSVVNNLVESVAAPALSIILLIGGFALMAPLIIALAYIIEYLIHPVSYSRTTALAEAINHAKRPILAAVAVFLFIYVPLLVIGLLSNNAQLTGNAANYALGILQDMLKEVANLFSELFNYALKSTP
jgi:hypothetical protein